MSTLTDAQALDAIATLLGTSAEWDADHLEDIANIVGSTDRPHPGDSAETYYRTFPEVTGRPMLAGWDSTDYDEIEATS